MKSPIAASALSIASPSRVNRGRGSPASVSSHAETAVSSARISAASSSEGSGDVGIERVTCALADHLCSELVAAQHALEGGVASDVNDAHRQRDLVPLRTTGLALAVPALGDVTEQRPHGPRQTEPVGEHAARPRRKRRDVP